MKILEEVREEHTGDAAETSMKSEPGESASGLEEERVGKVREDFERLNEWRWLGGSGWWMSEMSDYSGICWELE
ncbi:unnamed protein product [Sphagnum balticum]